MKAIINLIVLVCIPFIGLTQSGFLQNIKGQIVDQETGLPLIGANIVILDSDPLIGTTTDENGYFLLDNIQIGRHDLKASYLGYIDQTISKVLLTSGKELIVNFDLNERVLTGETVTVIATKDSDVKTSGLATTSIKEFDADLASRFSGSRNDVSRMASGFAGVITNDDSRNDIIIRGNSPSGLLWKLDGIDIPNPSHFGALGATGGPVSMLNNNMLSNSIFMTGAFPANYGNALSGVFDLSLRKGNKDKFEGTGQIGFNGFELGLEGPFSKNNKASYLINYRYSALALFSQIFGDGSASGGTGTGEAIPFYQDLSFKVNLPTKKLGTFSLIGLGGLSDITFLSDLDDSQNQNLFSDSRQNLKFATNMGVIALSNKHYFDNQSSGKLSISLTTSGVSTFVDELDSNLVEVPIFRDNSNIQRSRLAYDYKRKFNAKNAIYAGINTQNINLNLIDSSRVNINEAEWITLRDFSGNAFLSQAYTQWQHKFSDKLVTNIGLFGQWFDLNNSYALEPRFNLKYQFSPKLNFTVGLGRHSKIQDLQLYFIQTKVEQEIFETNKELKMTASNHLIAGIEYQINSNWNLNVETYLQNLSKVPVEMLSSTYSTLNDGADFGIPSRDSLINSGTEKNYGAEFTLERKFDKGFYLLSTLSLFRSTYVASDNIRRSTAFDNRYVGNILVGKEFKIKDRISFSIDSRFTAAGGKVVTPIDLQQSILENEEIRDESAAFSERLGDFLRTDLKLSIRLEGKKATQTWSLDLQNLFDNQNLFDRSYNINTQEIQETFQLGRYPVFDYRITF